MSEFQDKLKRGLLGDVPTLLSILPHDKIIEVASAHGIDFVNGVMPEMQSVNLIGIFLDLIPEIQHLIGGTDGKMGAQAFQGLYTFQRSFHLELKYKLDISNKDKLKYFSDHKIGLKMLIDALSIYDMDFYIDTQYLTEVEGYIEYYAKLVEEESPKPLPFVLSTNWKHEEVKLTRLSERLYEDGFTSSKEAFKQAFDFNNNGKCDWQKDMTALMYLLWLLFDKGKEKQSPNVISICISRFTIKGSVVQKKDAQSCKIKGGFKDAHNAKGHYNTIRHSILDSNIPIV